MSLVECSNVSVKISEKGGAGAFANKDFQKNELIEKGIVRIVPVDGNNSPYVFTWSEDRTVWAIGSGCSTFYNSSSNDPNTYMVRHYQENRFEIFANRDIQQGEELLHTYKSLNWRTCFVPIIDK